MRMDNNRISKRMFNTRPEEKEELENLNWDGGYCGPWHQDFRREELEEFGIK
jgi:hypothetical protein